MKINTIFVISAPSGTGKSTVVHGLIEKYQRILHLELVITYTSRLPREGEVDGRDYYFLDKDIFLRKIQENFFLEYIRYDGHYYGTSYKSLDFMPNANKISTKIVILTRMGALTVKKKYAHVSLIWLTPPSEEILQERLIQRCQGKLTKEVATRYALALKELQEEKDNMLYDYHIENNNLEATIETIADLIRAKSLHEKQ